MEELRELFHEKAESMRIPTALPPATRRRAHRERVGAVVSAALLTAVLAGGGVFASNLITSERRTPLAGPTPTAAPTPIPEHSQALPSNLPVHVMNGTSDEALTGEAAGRLDQIGYAAIEHEERYDGPVERTFVMYRPGFEAMANDVARRFGSGILTRPSDKHLNPDFSVTLVIGSDFRAGRGGIGEAMDIVVRFLEARRDDQAAERFLAKQAREAYDSKRNRISLYSPSAANRYGSFQIDPAERVGSGRFRFRIRFVVREGSPDCYEVLESLLVGPASNQDGEKTLLVLEALRLPTPGVGCTFTQ